MWESLLSGDGAGAVFDEGKLIYIYFANLFCCSFPFLESALMCKRSCACVFVVVGFVVIVIVVFFV